jgi:hypothetical protein
VIEGRDVEWGALTGDDPLPTDRRTLKALRRRHRAEHRRPTLPPDHPLRVLTRDDRPDADGGRGRAERHGGIRVHPARNTGPWSYWLAEARLAADGLDPDTPGHTVEDVIAHPAAVELLRLGYTTPDGLAGRDSAVVEPGPRGVWPGLGPAGWGPCVTIQVLTQWLNARATDRADLTARFVALLLLLLDPPRTDRPLVDDKAEHLARTTGPPATTGPPSPLRLVGALLVASNAPNPGRAGTVPPTLAA